jgi:Flp pilus assembly pilin Flp
MFGRPRGVTTTEYALILGVIAVALYGTYRAMGTNIGLLVNGVDSALTMASYGASAVEPTPAP